MVINAVVAKVVAVENEGLADFERVIQINDTAGRHLSKLCGQVMIAQGSGSIVNVASMLGFIAARITG